MKDPQPPNPNLEKTPDAVRLDRLEQFTGVLDRLNELIALNRGIVAVYKTAVDRLQDTTNIQLLQKYARQHQQFVQELSAQVNSLGGIPQTTAEGSSIFKQARVTLKAVFTSGDGPVLTAVAQDAANVVEAYREAMAADLPEVERDLVRSHLSQARLAHEKLSGLSEVY